MMIEHQHTGKPVKVPAAGEQIWHWFRELDCQREGTGFGVNPIGFRSIAAWAALREINLLPWQIDAIIAMDLKRMAMMNAPPKQEQEEQPNVASRPLTGRLFDALFPSKKR